WNEDGAICTSQDKSGCLRYKPDQWMTFYYEQKIGAWGQPNSIVRVSMAEEGRPLETFIEFTDFTFKSDKAASAYRDIWIGPYSLGRTADAAYPTARTWFDEFIISREPIADPFQGNTGIRDGAPGWNGKNAGLDIQSIRSGSRISITLPVSGRPADIHVYDRQGRKVESFKGIGAHSVEWDASGSGNGIYLVKAIIGNRIFTRKFSILE